MTTNQKATLVWEKRNVYAGTSIPTTLHALTDVDLYMYRESDNSSQASSLTTLNNVEQVGAPTPARMVLKADVFSGSIAGLSSEPMSMAVQGTNAEAGVRGPTIRITSTPVVCPGASFITTAQMRHWGNIVSHTNAATLAVPGGFTLTGGANPQNFAQIAAGSRGTASWTITAPGAGAGVFGATGGVSSYGEVWSVLHNLTTAVQSPTFSDVACGHPFYGYIQRLATKGVTAGCAPSVFCPGAAVDRWQMAVFIIKAMRDVPATCAGTFTDVPIGSPGCEFVERLVQLGITTGCTPTLYCPTLPVSRGQMAVFIVRARALADARWTVWAKPGPTFADVPGSHPFQGHIERLFLEQVTDGCNATDYCPAANITRGEMAVFLVRAFPTQW